ncbi:MAG: SMI1/KNR4 family protein [Methylococcaceae bacterium]|nr:SMI1/KNR4 family protein [Methylococcaceae bacterium]
MKSTISNIRTILRPPVSPVDPPDSLIWNNLEINGLILPLDYKEFLELYGSGHIDNFIFLFNPRSRNQNLNLSLQIELQLQALRDLKKLFDIDIPYSLFPTKGGILPFGATDNGDILFWITRGEPNDWTIVVMDSRAPEWSEHNTNMLDFLFDILKKNINCPIFPQGFPSEQPDFKPSLKAG